MNKLIIELTEGDRQEYTFLGWKDDGLAFYAVRPDGRPAMVEPVAAYPGNVMSKEPFRFPRIIPFEIRPERFRIVWPEHYREVLGRWREAKLAEVSGMTVEKLFPLDALRRPKPTRLPYQVQQARQKQQAEVERHYNNMTGYTLAQLLDPAWRILQRVGLHPDVMGSPWAEQLGDGYLKMIKASQDFVQRCLETAQAATVDDVPWDLGKRRDAVQLLMRGDDGRDFHLLHVEVRPPTDREAESHERMSRLHNQSGPARERPAAEAAKAAPQLSPVNRMRFAGAKRWEISFGAHEPFMATGNGIGWELAYVLKHPHTELHVLTVQHALAIPTADGEAVQAGAALEGGLSPKAGTHQIKRRPLTAEKYCQARTTLEADLKAARAADELLLAEEAEEKLERLEAYQKEAQHPEQDWAKSCNDRLRVGLKRFKEAIAKERKPAGRALLDHLEKHLTLARYKFHYHPPEGFDWED
jgi:hypothetical protein